MQLPDEFTKKKLRSEKAHIDHQTKVITHFDQVISNLASVGGLHINKVHFLSWGKQRLDSVANGHKSSVDFLTFTASYRIINTSLMTKKPFWIIQEENAIKGKQDLLLFHSSPFRRFLIGKWGSEFLLLML